MSKLLKRTPAIISYTSLKLRSSCKGPPFNRVFLHNQIIQPKPDPNVSLAGDLPVQRPAYRSSKASSQPSRGISSMNSGYTGYPRIRRTRRGSILLHHTWDRRVSRVIICEVSSGCCAHLHSSMFYIDVYHGYLRTEWTVDPSRLMEHVQRSDVQLYWSRCHVRIAFLLSFI